MFSSLVMAVAALFGADSSNSALESAAETWVRLVDQQKWSDSWRAAGSLFHSQITSQQWQAAAEPIRKTLGPVQSRILEKVTATKSLPGAPDGDYQVLEYRTTFANKAAAVETLILAKEKEGWLVNGYFVR